MHLVYCECFQITSSWSISHFNRHFCPDTSSKQWVIVYYNFENVDESKLNFVIFTSYNKTFYAVKHHKNINRYKP